MNGEKSNIVRREFFKVTKLLPKRLTNRIEDKQLRKDAVFSLLAEDVFSRPMLLTLLEMKIPRWLLLEKTEFTYTLAGYVYYFKEDFKKAEGFFIKALGLNPENLDTWFDLAFSLYHQNTNKHNLGKFILFNYETVVSYFSVPKKRDVTLEALFSYFLRFEKSEKRIN